MENAKFYFPAPPVSLMRRFADKFELCLISNAFLKDCRLWNTMSLLFCRIDLYVGIDAYLIRTRRNLIKQKI